jgi:type IV pilus assembly protein PilV
MMILKCLKRKRQEGMSLIEVLITLIILAFGLLGIAGVLMFSNKANNSSYLKQQAVQSVYDIFDRMRTNYQAAINGNYNMSNMGSNGVPTSVPAPSPLCTSTACTPSQMAAYDIWFWINNDVNKLPNGSASITSALSGTAGNTIMTVTVQWDDSPAQTALGASSSTSTNNANFVQFSVQSQL